MAQSFGGGGGGGGGGAEFDLPDEILSVMPTDPYEQLDLARKITSMAIASRVSRLEAEAGKLRQRLAEKDQAIADLQDRLSDRDRAFQDAQRCLGDALEENVKLSKDRDTLTLTVKKLSRDLAKMENFKRHLMQSLKEDGASQTETVDIQTYDQEISRTSSWKDEGSIGFPASSMLKESENASLQDASIPVGLRSSITPYITPRLTPTATPKVTSTAVSPKITSGATSPTKPYSEGHTLSTLYPPSEQSSAANSPPRGRTLPGRTPRVDGKEFFRQARSRLSYEQFGAFLLNIKELNAHRQSREDTLRKAEEIFGSENKDLYLSFQGLLNRSLR